jgi:hypothetical protein
MRRWHTDVGSLRSAAAQVFEMTWLTAGPAREETLFPMRRILLPLLTLSLAACGPAEQEEDDFVEDLTTLPADEGKSDGPQRVRDYLRACTTAGILPLAKQVAERMACIAPGMFTDMHETSRIRFTGEAVLAFLARDAVADLEVASNELGSIQIESGLRTLPQQVLIRAWYERGRCNISAAAEPGRSNHETARALDITNYGLARKALERHGWKQLPGDAVHFDHLASPDARGLDVIAFQQLWNLNNPGDRIDEDGKYDGATAQRVLASPAKGFALNTCPESPVFD